MRGVALKGTIFAFCMVASFLLQARRALCDGELPAKPVVLMLVLGDRGISKVEEGLVADLELELDTHALEVVEGYSFKSNTVPKRMEEIRALAVEHGADAVIWLELLNEETIALQLVVTAPGRSAVRTIETRIGPETGGELAISTREQLKDIHITMKELEEEPGDSKLAPKSEPMAEPPPPGPWLLGVGGVISGGLYKIVGPSFLLGGQIWVGYGFKSGFHLDASLEVFGAPNPEMKDAKFKTYGLRPGVGIAFLVPVGRITIGPHLGMIAPWRHVEISFVDGEKSWKSYWNLRFVPALDFRVHLSRNVLLLLRPGMGVQARRVIFKRVSDRTFVFASPFLDWNVTLGIIFNFN